MPTLPPATENPALDAFLFALQSIRERLAVLTYAANQNLDVDPEELDWGNVGDANRLRELLDQAVECLPVYPYQQDGFGAEMLEERPPQQNEGDSP